MEKSIKDFEDYTIDEEGNVYSYKYNKKHKMATWLDGKGIYVDVKLSKNGHVTHKNIHRLVAETFIPNPLNLPEVDHIDNNPQNNHVSNLRWCNRKENLYKSYATMSPVRHYKVTELKIAGKHIYYFKSTTLACKYASKLGYSYASLEKYRKTKDAEIIHIDVTTIENGEKIIEFLTEVE